MARKTTKKAAKDAKSVETVKPIDKPAEKPAPNPANGQNYDEYWAGR